MAINAHDESSSGADGGRRRFSGKSTDRICRNRGTPVGTELLECGKCDMAICQTSRVVRSPSDKPHRLEHLQPLVRIRACRRTTDSEKTWALQRGGCR